MVPLNALSVASPTVNDAALEAWLFSTKPPEPESAVITLLNPFSRTVPVPLTTSEPLALKALVVPESNMPVPLTVRMELGLSVETALARSVPALTVVAPE